MERGDTMTASKDERLSALVDDEAGSFATRRLCDELAADADTRRRWEDYHLIGAAMRGELAACRKGFADSVMRQIAEEAAPAIRPRRRPGAITGIAAAATVAAAGIFGVQMFAQQEEQQTAPVAVFDDGVSGDPAVRVAVENRRIIQDARMNAYYINHAEHGSRQVMVPYARLVSYESHAPQE